MTLAKRWLTVMTNNAVGNHVITLLEGLHKERPNLLRVLTYHQVEDLAGFDQQMQYLSRYYHVVSTARVLEACKEGTPLPPRSVLITFDDAYRNFAECAWPVLKRYGLPVTLFVPTAFPDRPDHIFWWDRLEHALRHTGHRDHIQTPIGRLSLATNRQRYQAFLRLRRYLRRLPHSEILAWTYQLCRELDTPQPESQVLSWDELRQLANEGVTLGAHTRTHPSLDQLSSQEAQAEAVGSLQDLEREVGQAPPIFAYPGGQFREDIVQALRQAGFALAFTTIRGVNDLRYADPLRLRRINIGRRATLPVLRVRLLHSSWYLNQLRPLAKAS
ncbi:MAG: polysaccharide deacetylase family protein [Chloroflexi bacterium]|nr:polysaccharide deacetylase family protein [Chloroflexota bacterium]MCI0575254.1 polysaccharide deacetylase family protein [Chloroflexota bacterium]MCI0645700.1 polysaccharide deacetylase family protein [Chloroflexota bacterium]MCI0731231.1 polysaccharide deacetylase family protein [Chloroflexota bacterium]